MTTDDDCCADYLQRKPHQGANGYFIKKTIYGGDAERINLRNIDKGVDHPGQNKARDNARAQVKGSLGKYGRRSSMR